jgi:hypothetical protein
VGGKGEGGGKGEEMNQALYAHINNKRKKKNNNNNKKKKTGGELDLRLWSRPLH